MKTSNKKDIPLNNTKSKGWKILLLPHLVVISVWIILFVFKPGGLTVPDLLKLLGVYIVVSAVVTGGKKLVKKRNITNNKDNNGYKRNDIS